MRAVDTNVLVRLIIGDEPKQVITAEWFVANGVWVSHLVLAETIWVLGETYKRDADEIIRAIEKLLRHSSIAVQDADVVVAALEQFRRRPSLGFSDCLILEIARKAGHLPLGTFDRNLSKLEGIQRL
jgi:predicted nucleic-acid-binding protein